MRTLLFWLLCTPLVMFGQYQFSGQLSDDHKNQTVYLSIVENYRKSSRIYLDQIISTTTTDNFGAFRFEGDNLSDKNHLYRIHIDDCNYTSEKTAHFLKECNYTESLLFLAKNRDTISIPLLANNQALCEINSTNNTSTLILEINTLREEMILDFLEYPSKANEDLNFKKWFSRLQKFGIDSGEPVAELYIYNFLSDRASETHAFYLNHLQHNEYYIQLLNRLKNKYPNTSFTTQFQREITADKIMPEDTTTSFISVLSDYIVYIMIGVVGLTIAYIFYRKKERKNNKKYFDTLTTQEKTIIEKIGLGKSNKEIAAELFISLSTVKTHINNIYKKLNVTSREELKALF